jgi:thiosulfate/3-mercaptopyruvate sulfurtransferase
MFRYIRLLMFAAVGLAVCHCMAQTPQTSAAAKRPEMLVSTHWLADHLNDPNLVIIETGDELADSYAKQHIPGARFLPFEDYVDKFQGEMGRGSGQYELPSPEKLKAVLEKLGLRDDSRIVIYTADWYPHAARVYYTLDYLGLADHAALLDGSIAQWMAEKRPVTAASPNVALGKLTIKVNEHVRAKLDEVKQVSLAKESSTVLLDSRPNRRYEAGHIPGAQHIFWQDTVADEKHPLFKSPAELRTLFANSGIAHGKKVVTYCEVGIQASHNYFVAKYLGFNAAMYDGSFGEWHPLNLPIITGKNVR